MMYWYGTGMSGWAYAFMIMGMLLFWCLIVGGIVLLIRYLGGAHRPGRTTLDAPDVPERILAERLARGEIDEEDYRHRLAVLRTPRP